MSNELIRTMFKHLVKTYPVTETREILTAKFPDAKELINSLSSEDFLEEERVQEAKVKRLSAEKKVKAETAKRTSNKRTKSDENKKLSMEIYKKNLDKTRKEVIDIIINEVKVTPSTGSNLYHWCKRELKNDSGKDV